MKRGVDIPVNSPPGVTEPWRDACEPDPYLSTQTNCYSVRGSIVEGCGSLSSRARDWDSGKEEGLFRDGGNTANRTKSHTSLNIWTHSWRMQNPKLPQHWELPGVGYGTRMGEQYTRGLCKLVEAQTFIKQIQRRAEPTR